MTGPARLSLEERLHQFVDELRTRGLPVSMVERVDAMQAVAGTDLARRGRLHTALSATLVKDVDHLAVFDEAFDLFFRTAGPVPDVSDAGALSDEALDLDDAVRAVLQDGSDALARLVADEAVTRFARFEPGRRVAGVLYERWTLDGLRLTDTVDQLSDGNAGAGEGSGSGGGGGNGGSGGGSGAGTVQENAENLRRHVVAVIRERMVADRGPADVARVLRTPLTADVDLTAASAAQLAEIERSMPVLQRKLATTLLRRRRRARGPLDVRATMRHAMATGGIPVTLVERPPRPTKPQLFVLADMSGSVANFAAFSISLMAAMAPLFSGLRTFVFVRDTVEVTDVVRRARTSREAAATARATLDGARLGGATDYGRALTTFRDTVHGTLGHRSTVLVLGDARGNHQPAHAAALADVARRAGAVHWLNPEPRTLWGTGDSLAPVYAPLCTDMVVCRTVHDLERFVARLA
ncbi:VWA domain-containing protein [Jatrophihabitans sp. YIM 134969]